MSHTSTHPQTIEWSGPPDTLDLASGHIDIWHLPLNTLPCRPELLEPTELQRLGNYRHASGRQQYCASRTALRSILGNYLNCRASEVPLVIKPGGKPRLGPEPPPLYFNLSHANGTALLAVCADHKVGVDVENVREIPDYIKIAQRVFSPAELERLDLENWSLTTFYRLWTALEARQKCLGRGVFGHAVEEGTVVNRVFSLDSEQYAAIAWPERYTDPDIRFYTL